MMSLFVNCSWLKDKKVSLKNVSVRYEISLTKMMYSDHIEKKQKKNGDES